MKNLIRVYHYLNTTVNATINTTTNKTAITKQAKGIHSKNLVLVIVLSVVGFIIVTLAIFFYIKRKRAYEDYNKNPESFIRKPSSSQLDRVEESEETFIREEYYNKASKNTEIAMRNLTEGRVFEITFYPAGGGQWCSVSFTRLLEETSYFEVQILSTRSEVMIGYGYAPDIERRFDRKKDIGSVAVGFSNIGRVKNNGILTYNYELDGSYGDCIGIGITKQDMRVWFTHNGVLLNQPTGAQQERWFRENVEQQIESEKKTRKAKRFIDKLLGRKHKKQKNTVISKAQLAPKQRKDDIKLQKQKVSLHDQNFTYCAYISCITDQQCHILVNTGGQVFRFPQHEFKEGLYKQKQESDEEQEVEEEQED